jgi:hypothetical protein
MSNMSDITSELRIVATSVILYVSHFVIQAMILGTFMFYLQTQIYFS